MTTIHQALQAFPKERYYHEHVKALENQRRLFTANLGVDMGEDWFKEAGDKLRSESLLYYVRMFLQATINRQFQMGAQQVHNIIKRADEHSGMASLDPVQMEYIGEDKAETAVIKVPAIYMEKVRAEAKERRERARKIIRSK